MSDNKKEIKIGISQEAMKGTYANWMQVGHTKEEFHLDFATVFGTKGLINARIILSPGHTKRVIRALVDNLAKYEKKFGQVKEAEEPQQSIGFEIK